ncbi:hypothetical protein Tco_0072857 [Tanacetum coccineum]
MLYVRGRSSQIDMEQGTDSAYSKSHGRSSRRMYYICQSDAHLKMDCPRADVMMVVSVEQLLDWIMDSGGSYHMTYKRDYLFNFEEYDSLVMVGNVVYGGQSGKIKVIRGSLVVLSGTKRANYVYTLEDQAMTRKTLKGRQQLGEYQTGWKIKTQDTTMSTNLVNRSPSLAIRFKTPVDMLRDGSMKVLQGVEFKVEPQEDHTFEVEPHRNVNHVAGSHEVQTHDLMDIQLVIGSNTQHVSYSVGSQEYQVVCTRPDTASASADLLDGFDHGLQTYVQKEAIWLKGFFGESGADIKLVVVFATGALIKVVPGLTFQH